jgi:hypothetical protein
MDGQEIWSWTPSLKLGESAYIRDIAPADTGVTLLTEISETDDSGDRMWGLYLTHLSSKGVAEPERPISVMRIIGDHSQTFRTWAVVDKEDATQVFLSRQNLFRPDITRSDEFGDFLGCIAEDTEVISVPDDASLAISSTQNPGLVVRRVIRHSGRTLVAGFRQVPCKNEGYAYYGSIDKDGVIHPIHIENSLYGSEFTDIAANGQSVVLSTKWARKFTVSDDVGYMDASSYADSENDHYYRLGKEEYEVTEGMFVLIDEDQFVRRDFISAGGPVLVNDLSYDGNRVSYSGRAGSNPLFGSFEYPN